MSRNALLTKLVEQGVGHIKNASKRIEQAIKILEKIGGKVIMANTEDKGEAEIPADTSGEVIKIRIDGSYLAQALKACGGMVELKLTNPYSPMLFTTDGYELVVMSMMTNEASEQAKRDREAKATEGEAQAKPSGETEGVTEGEAEPEADKSKRKRKAKEPVAVA